jgi:hypothetical protein
LVGLAVVVVASGCGSADRSGTEASAIEGVVTNQCGDPVTEATVDPVAHEDVDIPAIAVETAPNGHYRFSPLSAGTYDVIIRARGYADAEEQVSVPPGETASLDVRLTSRKPKACG